MLCELMDGGLDGRRWLYVGYDYYIQQSCQQTRMMAGEAVAILICAAIALVLLFYLVTRYFNYRLQKSLQHVGPVYSMVDGLEAPKDEMDQDEHEEFVDNKIHEWDQRDNQRKQMCLQLAEIGQKSNIRSSLYTINDDLNLYGQLPRGSIPVMQESYSSYRSIKSIIVQKIEESWLSPTGARSFNKDSQRSMNSRLHQPSPASSVSSSSTTHKFISKLVCYKDQNITIVQNNVAQIWTNINKGKIRQRRSITKKYINANETNFLDMLQSYGFEYKTNGAFKFECTVQIKNMKPSIIYSVSQASARISKQQVTVAEFEQLAKELEQKQS